MEPNNQMAPLSKNSEDLTTDSPFSRRFQEVDVSSVGLITTHTLKLATGDMFLIACNSATLGETKMTAEFLNVATRADLASGDMASFDVGGVQIALAKVDGDVYAFGDLCTHRQCSLADGDLDGTTVTCICHGSEFDVRTGQVLAPPAEEPVSSYNVRIIGDDVQVEI